MRPHKAPPLFWNEATSISWAPLPSGWFVSAIIPWNRSGMAAAWRQGLVMGVWRCGGGTRGLLGCMEMVHWLCVTSKNKVKVERKTRNVTFPRVSSWNMNVLYKHDTLQTLTDLRQRRRASTGGGVTNNLVKISMQALSSFSSHGGSENRFDCHPADGGSFHFQAWPIHYKPTARALRLLEPEYEQYPLLTVWNNYSEADKSEAKCKMHPVRKSLHQPLGTRGSMCLEPPLI